MILSSYGHAKFLLETAEGLRIVTDPFDASTGYPVPPLRADAALVSHHHHDHDAVDTVQGVQKVVDTAGTHQLSPGTRVTALPSFHDPEGGKLRGSNLVFVVESEGLRVVHCGDLGHLPDDQLVKAIGRVDVLLVPVGGHFTIDARQAKAVCELLRPRIIVPMHYRTQYNAGWPIAPVDDFLSLFPQPAEEVSLLRVTAGDLDCQPPLVLLKPVF